MGKKSKAPKAKAKAAAGSGAVATASVEVSSGGKQRCTNCLSTLKDLAKARPCPGCSMLYCWRCEKKMFTGCPNGEHCVHPMRRCINCCIGETMKKELILAGAMPTSMKDRGMQDFAWGTQYRKLYMDIISRRDDLTIDSMSCMGCDGDACAHKLDDAVECIQCAEGDSTTSKLGHCFRCSKLRCAACTDVPDIVFEDTESIIDDIWRSGRGRAEMHDSEIVSFGKRLTSNAPDGMIKCGTCARGFCFECIDFVELKFIVDFCWASREKHVDDEVVCPRHRCSHCYWSAKPCTNPSCPNEVGVPTKRCGGCHIERYCSVECQATMYPAHVKRCKKIQEKRVACKKVVA